MNAPVLQSTFVELRRQTCPSCFFEWRIFSHELEAAYEQHVTKCCARQRAAKGRVA